MIGVKYLFAAVLLAVSFSEVQAKGAEWDLFLKSYPHFLDSKQSIASTFEKTKTKRVFLFYASYCGFCEAEMPGFLKLAKNSKKCEFYGVNLDLKPEVAIQNKKDWGIDIPIIHDSEGLIRKSLGVRKIPSLVTFTADSKLEVQASGIDELSSALKALNCQ